MKWITKADVWQWLLLFNLVLIAGLNQPSNVQETSPSSYQPNHSSDLHFSSIPQHAHLSEGLIEVESEEEDKEHYNTSSFCSEHAFLSQYSQQKTEIQQGVLWGKSIDLIHHSSKFRHLLNMNFRL